MIAITGIAASGLDFHARAFANYLQTTFSYTTTGAQNRALNALVRELKRTGIWDKIVACYPFVGGTANTHSVNLKAVGTYGLTFVGSPTHNATGMLLNGTTQYASSPFTPNADTGQNNAHFAQYTTGAATNSFRIGCGVASNLFRLNSNIAAYSVSVNSSSSGTISVAVPGAGMGIASRINSSEEYVRFDTYSATRTAASTVRSVLNVLIGSNNMSGTPTGFADGYTQFASLGLGLTTTQMEQYKNAVNQFNLTLGR